MTRQSGLVTSELLERAERPHLRASSGSPAISAVLSDLGEARAQLLGRKRREQLRVGEHRGRLMEGSDVVLRLGKVDAGLAAVGGVDLRDHRRRNLHDRDATLVDGRAEAGRGRRRRRRRARTIVSVRSMPAAASARSTRSASCMRLAALAGRDGDRAGKLDGAAQGVPSSRSP